jgi:hypothetical protein
MPRSSPSRFSGGSCTAAATPGRSAGTRSREHLRENLGAASVRLEPGLLARLEALVHNRSVSGQRYNAANTVEIDTERFT